MKLYLNGLKALRYKSKGQKTFAYYSGHKKPILAKNDIAIVDEITAHNVMALSSDKFDIISDVLEIETSDNNKLVDKIELLEAENKKLLAENKELLANKIEFKEDKKIESK
jgi:hypothetical protein